MGAALKRLGFQVIEGFDLDKAAFDERSATSPPPCKAPKWRVLLRRARAAGVGPELSRARRCAADERLGASISRWCASILVHRTMERQAQDQHPLLRCLPRQSALPQPRPRHGHALGRDRARPRPRPGGVGTLISFSTQPGKVALDGKGRNSPFAGALVRQLARIQRRPGRHPDRRAQRRHEGDRAQAGAVGALGADRAVLLQSRRPGLSPAPQPRPSEAAEAWSAAKDTTNIAVLRAFVARYKDTFFAELARARIEELERHRERKSRRLPRGRVRDAVALALHQAQGRAALAFSRTRRWPSRSPASARYCRGLQQAVLAERVDVELDHAAVRSVDFLLLQIDGQVALAPRLASSISLSTSSCGSLIGRMPFWKQLLKKMSAKSAR